MGSTETSLVGRVLEWLKAGHPDGIPPRDYPPVLGVLQRNLTDAEIESIADELALQSVSYGDVPVRSADVRRMLEEKAFQSATAADMRRVSALLAAGGWPLSANLTELGTVD